MNKSSLMTIVPQTSLVHKTEQVIGRSYDWLLRKKNSVSSEFHKLSLLKYLLKTAVISRVYVQMFRCKHLTGKMSPQLIWAFEDDRFENLHHKSVPIMIFFQASF